MIRAFFHDRGRIQRTPGVSRLVRQVFDRCGITHTALAVAVALLATTSVRTEERYTIQLKKTVPGSKMQHEKTLQQKTVIQVFDDQGKLLKNDEILDGEETAYLETTLEKGEGQKDATKLRREYQKAKVAKNKQQHSLSCEGKTVVIEKKSDKYRFQIEGGSELTGPDVAKLDKEFNEKDDLDYDKIFQPKAAVSVGESWKVDAAALVEGLKKSAPAEFDTQKATANAKLARAYKQNDRQFGVIEISMEFPLKSLNLGPLKGLAQAGSKFVIKGTMDACIDGTVSQGTTKALLQVNAEVTVNDAMGRKFKVITTSHATEAHSAREVLP